MTQFTIHRSALLPALDRVGRIVERRNTIPILANMRMTVEGDQLRMTATDLDMEITATAELQSAGEGDVTLPAALLGDFIKKLPESAIIEFTAGETGRIRVAAGRTRAHLPFLPPQDFPELAGGEFVTRMEIAPQALARILSTVQFAISSEETRYYLNGIYLHRAASDGEAALRAVATDGHRLARSEMPAPTDSGEMPAIIIPRKTVAEMLKLTKGIDDAERLVLEVSAAKVRLSMPDGTVLTSKLIDGTYPDYQRVIPASNPKRYTLKVAALASAVDRVSTISAERGRAVKFRFGGEEVQLECMHPDMGEASDSVVVDGTEGEGETEIGFNGRYCHDALGAVVGENVTFALADPGSPAVITGANSADLFVLMPMRV
ncbi:DNA polymerase III subunit beta [Aliihoeflea sp. 40Bstr573]|uniref:DNA polymerase III subunit beta n=1 Tax=Aliihoeflea sp. 40Bstr573 TaxID=2696467 RepID=UPI002094AEA3|nr:DNA polymerase III subunit beta [Aliihoeflea sp. 40Bstr573]MCO6386382.1 DNA polymerase III subunit beta [Aliihoeflea sp. 40Bstr573]